MMIHTVTVMRIDKRGMLGDVVDWLGEACSSLDKKGRTHLLRSPGRPL